MSAASAGDVNADGYSDLIVGAAGWNDLYETEGKAFLYLGSPSGVPSDPSVSIGNPEHDPGGYFGQSVGVAGDVDGDGYADVVVGAPQQGDGGCAFLYAGGPTGLAASPSARLEDPEALGGGMGWSVSSAGDVNGDGYADVIVGAWGRDAGALDEGGAFVFLGGPSGIDPIPTVILDNPDNQVGGEFGASVL